MQTPETRPQGLVLVRKPALLAGLVAWALLSPWSPAHGPATGARLAAARFWGASSTPDSDTSAAEADPRAHRWRLLNALGVPSWHTAGHRGRGLKVAVLDSGFRGYKTHL